MTNGLKAEILRPMAKKLKSKYMPTNVVSESQDGNQVFYFQHEGRPKILLTEEFGTDEFYLEVDSLRLGLSYEKGEEHATKDTSTLRPVQRQLRRGEIPPASLPPFGVSREQPAGLLGIGYTLFDWAVANGKMPKARMLKGRRIWDVDELRDYFKRLPHAGGEDGMGDEEDPDYNPWDDA